MVVKSIFFCYFLHIHTSCRLHVWSLNEGKRYSVIKGELYSVIKGELYSVIKGELYLSSDQGGTIFKQWSRGNCIQVIVLLGGRSTAMLCSISVVTATRAWPRAAIVGPRSPAHVMAGRYMQSATSQTASWNTQGISVLVRTHIPKAKAMMKPRL